MVEVYVADTGVRSVQSQHAVRQIAGLGEVAPQVGQSGPAFGGMENHNCGSVHALNLLNGHLTDIFSESM